MNRPFLVLSFFLLGIATVSVNAQEYSSNSDSSHHPAPVYSKAEKKQMAKYRRVHGVVKDEHDNPVKSALVNLTNLTTKETVTYITKNDGVYSFDNLSRTEDYNLVASFNGKKTPVKKLSHFDQQPSSMRILTFEPPEQSAASSATQK